MNMEANTPREGTALFDDEPTVRRRRRWGGVALAALVVAGGSYALLHHDAPPPAPPAPQVTVAQPLVRNVAEWDDYVGRFVASRTVEIRPRISGQVVAVHFRDGDTVRAGQSLFTIDPRPFAAALDEARADAASARSAQALARSDLARADRLKGDEAISAGEVDQLRARLQATVAASAAAEARVRSRALDLEWSNVRAPISGRISDRRADPGNQVSGGQGATGTLLTTINALDPIYFSFDASEALFLKAQRGRDKGAEVQVRLQDEADYRWRGRLDFTDNALDQGSGTIRGRATVANPGNFLTPGMFGNMRMGSGRPVRALLVPDGAVATDIGRKTVSVVGADNKVSVKPVVTGPLVAGLRVIRGGLAPGDRVVISGTQAATAGAAVTPVAGRITAQPVAAAASALDPAASQATLAN